MSEWVDLIPAYALGALDPVERAAFESWLQSSPEAQAQLAEYQAIADHLFVLAPARPVPDHLQADLRRRLAAARLPEPAPVSLPARLKKENWKNKQRASETIRNRLRKPTVRYGLGLAAAVVVLVMIGVWLRFGSGSNTTHPDPARLYAEIAAQTGIGQYPITPGEGQNALDGDLVVSANGERAVIRVAQLPVLDQGKTYQLWLLDAQGTLHSGGLFRGQQAEQVTYISIPLKKPITEYQRFGVTVEPSGGSPNPNGPTGPVIFRIHLTHS